MPYYFNTGNRPWVTDADDQRVLWSPDPDVLVGSAPPHFHALYAEFEALIDIRTLEVIRGKLPRRALVLVLEWAAQHRDELMEDWNLCETKQQPKKIAPLE
jgi:hypothetical protein